MADITSGLFTIVDGVSVISNATMQPVLTAVDLLTSRTRRISAGFTLDADYVAGVVPAQKPTITAVSTTSITIAAATTQGSWLVTTSGASIIINLPTASTVLPGTKYTFKKKNTDTIYTVTIAAAVSDKIGYTNSTSFILYAQDDYVTLECDAALGYWNVIATNGPILSISQSAPTTTSISSAWTAVGNGLVLLNLAPGLYDIEAMASLTMAAAGSVALALTNSLTPSTPISNCVQSTYGSSTSTVPFYVTIKNYSLLATATINLSYYGTSAGSSIPYIFTYQVGKIVARRVG